MKRIITVQDISCVGKCSLTVALPVISAAGVETSVLPTAVLSTHTAFPKFTFHDLTSQIEKISKTLAELDIGFDAIYTGYLGSSEQVALVSDMIERNGGGECKILVDPAMADHGKMYTGFTPDFARQMASLVAKADLAVPNLTEACFMLGIPYTEDYTEKDIRNILVSLTELGAKCAALTGISFEEGKLGVYSYNSESREFFSYFNEKLPATFHGTGDVFASATLGALMQGHSVESALTVAVDFTLECVKYTLKDENHRFYGVNFEKALPYYIERLKSFS